MLGKPEPMLTQIKIVQMGLHDTFGLSDCKCGHRDFRPFPVLGWNGVPETPIRYHIGLT